MNYTIGKVVFDMGGDRSCYLAEDRNPRIKDRIIAIDLELNILKTISIK